MGERAQEQKAREMDEVLLGLRQARRESGAVKGWLREVRQAVGIPVQEVARRLGVCRWEVYRLEQAEMESRIMLATLRKAAEALGCDLVYGLAPREGTLTEMASEQKGVRDTARKLALKKAKEKRTEDRRAWLELIGWRETILDGLRTALRRHGVRVRPRKTEQGVEEKQEVLQMVMRLGRLNISRAVVEQSVEVVRARREREAAERTG